MDQKLIKIIIIGIVGSVLVYGIVNAQTCPESTTVNGPTSITFVGGVADLGGDTQAYVWFEYGTSSGNYTFKTEKKLVTQLGKFCITVENLQPCTTYYYRAAMENQAGPSYGAELTRTTPCTEGESTSSGKVLGVATQAPTGLIDTLIDIAGIPFVGALILIFLLKSHIIAWEEWVEKRKKEYQAFKSEKLLKLKITKLKLKDKFNI